MNSEVLIIGGGVIGLCIARELQKRGAKDIAVVDRSRLGAEASWAAAGMLAPNIETDTSEAFHRLGVEALALYPNFAAELLDETGIDIELDRSGTLSVAFDEKEASDLTATFDRQKLRGVPVEHLSGDDIRKLEPSASNDILNGLLYPSDWQVENRKLLAALRKFAEMNQIQIIEGADVSRLVTSGDRIIGAVTSAGEIAAERTILATGAWTSFITIGEKAVPVFVKPIRGQMISFATGVRSIDRVIYSPRGYIVPRADGRVLMGATVEDVGFDKSTTDDGLRSLQDAAVEIIPSLGEFEIADRWAGLRPFAADGLPVIGEVPGWGNLFVATAHYRNGILLAAITGELIADEISGGSKPPLLEPFGVGRFAEAAGAGTI